MIVANILCPKRGKCFLNVRLLCAKIQPIFLTGKMFNKNISTQKLFFRQITLNQFIIHASKDLIITLLFI